MPAAETAGKPCADCGKTVHVPEIEWCLDCVMDILASDTPRALDLLSAELPLSAQIYAAGHCGTYAQTAVAGTETSHPAVLSYLLLASDIPAVRRLAMRQAATSVVAFVMLAEPDASLVDAAVTEMTRRGETDKAALGRARLDKLAAAATGAARQESS